MLLWHGKTLGARLRGVALAFVALLGLAITAYETPMLRVRFEAALKEGSYAGRENIYPAELERVLLEHPDVAECGVIGRPDPRWNEVPVAYVIRRSGSFIEAESLKAHVLTQLARFKVPRDIIFVDDLPRTALGKVQHFMLRQLGARAMAPEDAR